MNSSLFYFKFLKASVLPEEQFMKHFSALPCSSIYRVRMKIESPRARELNNVEVLKNILFGRVTCLILRCTHSRYKNEMTPQLGSRPRLLPYINLKNSTNIYGYTSLV